MAAIANYTSRVVDPTLPDSEHQIALLFIGAWSGGWWEEVADVV